MSKLNNTPANELIPGDLYVPGVYIKDEMAARGWNQINLATALGVSKSEISLLLSGKRNISVLLAVQLEKIFHIDAEIWMNIQVKYDIYKLRLKYSKELESISIPQSKRNELKKSISAMQ